MHGSCKSHPYQNDYLVKSITYFYLFRFFIDKKRSEVTKSETGPVFVGDRRGQNNDKPISTFRFSMELLSTFAQKNLGLQDFRCTAKSVRKLFATEGGRHVSHF